MAPKPKDQLGRSMTPNNAVWEISPGVLAIGSLKICQKITDSNPEDQEAVWEDADHVGFCIRPRSHSTGMPATYDENTLVKFATYTSGVGIYLVGRDVVVKIKTLNSGGSNREPEAMKLIRKQAPSVPVPEVFHHWYDPHWLCHITIMSRIPGRDIGWIWYNLDSAHQQRLVEEVADHIQTVGDIQSETAIYANGESLADGNYMPVKKYRDSQHNDNPKLNTKQLERFLEAKGRPYQCPSGGLGDRFHLCHMDPSSAHFFVHNGDSGDSGVNNLPLGPANISLEEQAKFHISGIIDWERSGFFPRHMVSFQFQGIWTLGLPYHQFNKPGRTAWEFDEAVSEALVRRGFPASEDIKYR